MNKITEEEIIKAVSDAFGIERQGNFPALLNDWVTKDEAIVSFKVDKENQNVIVIASIGPDFEHEIESTYSLYRFFPIGNKWACSVDIELVDAQDFINYILNGVKHKK